MATIHADVTVSSKKREVSTGGIEKCGRFRLILRCFCHAHCYDWYDAALSRCTAVASMISRLWRYFVAMRTAWPTQLHHSRIISGSAAIVLRHLSESGHSASHGCLRE